MKTRKHGLTLAAGVLAAFGWPLSSAAHVAMVAPIDGTSFDSSEVTTVSWEVTIPHTTQLWHLELSSDNGVSWDPVALDLPVEQRSYEWTVPAMDCPACQLRVTQDNAGTDYDDIVQITIVLVASTSDAGVDAIDAAAEAVDAAADGPDAADPGGGDGDGGGCGCSVGSQRPLTRHGPSLLLVLLAFACATLRRTRGR